MKTTLWAFLALFTAAPLFSEAQTWSGSTPGNIYYNSGNVGVGTSSPVSGGAAASWLSLNGTSTYSGGVAYTIGGTVKGFSYIDSDGLLTQQSISSGQKFVVNTSTTAMTILSGGNIGIGTTSPGSLLNLAGTEYVPGTSGSSQNSTFRIGATSTNLALDAGVTTSGTAPYSWLQSRNQANYAANYALALNPNGGNVGIGTTSPLEKATIANSDPQALGLYRDLDVAVVGRAGTYLNFGARSGTAFTTGAQITGALSSTSATGALYFSTLTSGSLTPKMTIYDSGNVGIGTTTPDQLLSVNGTIHSKEIRVDVTNLPDYVFKPAYHLPTLAEIKTYIDKNQHLPEVPSAQEAEQNGLNLGDMNKLLLKKIEELTLYLIEKDKQLAEQMKTDQHLQEQIDRLKQQMAGNANRQ